jgi:hypothetical protein
MIRQEQSFGRDEFARAAADDDDRILEAHARRVVNLFGRQLEAALRQFV